MSMPSISVPSINRNDALNSIIASIALQEAGLSHILNAEGEKLQHVMSRVPVVSLPDLIAVNASVSDIINNASKLEDILQNKLKTVIAALPSLPVTPTP